MDCRYYHSGPVIAIGGMRLYLLISSTFYRSAVQDLMPWYATVKAYIRRRGLGNIEKRHCERAEKQHAVRLAHCPKIDYGMKGVPFDICTLLAPKIGILDFLLCCQS